MEKLHLLAILYLPFIVSQCPRTVDIKPCKCIQDNNLDSLFCWGDMQLPRLTTILRDLMCGRTVEKFHLLSSNITYLPSNLFSRMIVREINVYSGNISRFTQGGRSAFYGLEGSLNSLSMRRCSLQDSLQWQMLGDMYALSYLDLSYNELTQIPTQWAESPPPNLRSLLLKGNKISALQPGALEWMYTLVELDLSENIISSYSRAALPHSAYSLIILRLSYNELENLPEDAFSGMYGLRRIYLDNNKLTTLEEMTWSSIWGDLEMLDLNDNQLECDIGMLWLSSLRPPTRLYGNVCKGNATA